MQNGKEKEGGDITKPGWILPNDVKQVGGRMLRETYCPLDIKPLRTRISERRGINNDNNAGEEINVTCLVKVCVQTDWAIRCR